MNKTTLLSLGFATATAITSHAAIIANGDFSADGLTDANGIDFGTTTTTGVTGWSWDGNETEPKIQAVSNYNSATDNFATGRGLDRGAVFQTTNETIVSGTKYSLTADVFNVYNLNRGTTELVTRLYYLDGSTRTYITGAENTYTGGNTQDERGNPSSIQIDYTGAGSAVGNKIGVEFSWESGTVNGSWQGFDNVAMTAAVPEPSSTALIGLGGLSLILRRKK